MTKPNEALSASESDPLCHAKWAAWGVIDIEKLERMQRRNYIKRTRNEFAACGWALTCGGTTRSPHYRLEFSPDHKAVSFTGPDAFRRACADVVKQLEETLHKETTAT
jgi:hypothetical protein